ncbi:MAG: SDR family oxidoreductase [Pseudomonadota bacterium]
MADAQTTTDDAASDEAQRSILITGCSSGIGYASAHGLKQRGWRVFATCRNEVDCERLRGEGLEAFVLDYQNMDSIAAGADEALSRTGGRLDALFNNGAFASPGAVEDLPTDAFREIFEANFFGWHELTRRVLPTMRAQGHGRIVQNSSVLGFCTLKYRGAYQSTKYALEGYTDTLRLELKGSGVEAVLIEPGPVDSRIRQNSYAHFKRWVRWEGSPHAAIYPKVEDRLTAEVVKSDWELPAEAVVKKLVHALESPRPQARYYVTTPTYYIAFMKRILSTRALDRLLIKQSY